MGREGRTTMETKPKNKKNDKQTSKRLTKTHADLAFPAAEETRMSRSAVLHAVFTLLLTGMQHLLYYSQVEHVALLDFSNLSAYSLLLVLQHSACLSNLSCSDRKFSGKLYYVCPRWLLRFCAAEVNFPRKERRLHVVRGRHCGQKHIP